MAFPGLVEALESAPLLVVLDDLHWADPSSLKLLGHLVAALGSRLGLIVALGRRNVELDVDTETGRVVPLRHVAVDDCGRILNPLLVAGQQHGGLAQGIAQADGLIFGRVVYQMMEDAWRAPATCSAPASSRSALARRRRRW